MGWDVGVPGSACPAALFDDRSAALYMVIRSTLGNASRSKLDDSNAMITSRCRILAAASPQSIMTSKVLNAKSSTKFGCHESAAALTSNTWRYNHGKTMPTCGVHAR